jgi:hypothetical protein
MADCQLETFRSQAWGLMRRSPRVLRSARTSKRCSQSLWHGPLTCSCRRRWMPSGHSTRSWSSEFRPRSCRLSWPSAGRGLSPESRLSVRPPHQDFGRGRGSDRLREVIGFVAELTDLTESAQVIRDEERSEEKKVFALLSKRPARRTLEPPRWSVRQIACSVVLYDWRSRGFCSHLPPRSSVKQSEIEVIGRLVVLWSLPGWRPYRVA